LTIGQTLQEMINGTGKILFLCSKNLKNIMEEIMNGIHLKVNYG